MGIAERVASVLVDDRGCESENYGPPKSGEKFPELISVDKGNYGDVDGLTVRVEVRRPGETSQVTVGVGVQFSASKVLGVLTDRIRSKDRPGNDIVLVTTGLIDQFGYVCPQDKWMFKLIMDNYGKHGAANRLSPDHISGVVMHNWNSPFICPLYSRPGVNLPWR